MILRPSLLILLTVPLAAAADKVTFDDHVMPIFQQSCLNCHNPDKAKGGLDLSTFAGTMKGGSGGKIVEPGDPGSKLVGCVLQTASPKMPPEGERVPAAQIDILKQWVEGGLLENKNSAARKPSKPKFEAAMGADPAKKPEGPPPMPADVLLEPPVVTTRGSAVHALAVSPWAPLLAVTGQRQVLLHDTNTLDLVGILPFPEGDPVSLAFTPDARYLIVGGGTPGKSGLTVTFDVTKGTRLMTAAKEFDSILAADIKPTFDLVATGGPSKLLKIWKTETGEMIASVKKHTDWITALDISNDGVLLASGDRNGGVWVWETDTASEFHTLRAHQAGITGLAFRADSNILASASEDGTVRMWEMNGGGEVKKIDAHPGGVTAFAFGRDGTFITAGRDNKAKLWKADFNPHVAVAATFPALPTAVALDVEAKKAFVADAAGTIRVFETAGGAALGEIQAAPPSIETRLRVLNELAGTHSQRVIRAEEAAKEKTAAIENAKKAVADAEAGRKQIGESNEATKAVRKRAKEELESFQQGRQKQKDDITRLGEERKAATADLEARRQALAALPPEQQDPAPVAAAEQKEKQLADQISQLQQIFDASAPQEAALTAALDGAAKNAAASQERIKPADEAISQARKEVDAATKNAADATAEIERVKNELPKIKADEKRWSAASINTHALAAADHAEKTSSDSEGELDIFTAATKAASAKAEELNLKRGELRKLQDGMGQADAVRRDELSATAAALEAVIVRETETLRKLEEEALQARAAVEQKLPLAHQAVAQASQLKQAYQKAKQ